jgi:hypothetical protein
MSTIANTAQLALEQVNQNLQDWNNQYSGLSLQQQELQQTMVGEQSQIDALNQQVSDDQTQLADLQEQLADASDDDKPAIQAQIDALNTEIAANNAQVAQLTQAKTANQQAYSALAPTFMTTSNVANQNSQDLQETEDEEEQNSALTEDSPTLLTSTETDQEQTTQDNTTTAEDTTDTTDTTNTTDTTDDSSTTGTTTLTPQQQAAQAMQLISDQLALINELNQQMWDDFNQITKDSSQISQDQAKIDELSDKITEDAIKMSACAAASIWTLGLSMGAAGYYAYLIAQDSKEKNQLQGDVSSLQGEVNRLNTEIQGILQQLSVLNNNVMTQQLQQITDEVKNILTSLLSALNSGNITEAQVQQASAAIVQVLSELQVVLAQIYSARSQDQQDMSKAGAMNYSMAVNTSSVDLQKFGEAVRHAKFMKITMQVAQVAIAAAGVIAAVATGGVGSILLAAAMAGLTMASVATGQDYMGKFVEAIATKMESSGKLSDAQAKVLAEIVVAVIIAVLIVATDGAATTAASKAAGTGAARGAGQAAEVELATFSSNVAADEAGQAADLVGNQLSRPLTTTEWLSSFFKRFGQNLLTKETAKELAGTAVMMAMMNNVLVDATQAIAEAKMGKDDADKAQWLQTLKIIEGILQAVLGMLAGAYAASGKAGFQKNVEEFLEKHALNISDVTLVGRAMQVFGNFGSILASALQAVNHQKMADIYEDLGTQKATMVIYKDIMDANKASEKTYSEQAAAQMQQLAAALQETVAKFYSGEREAARVIGSMAV